MCHRCHRFAAFTAILVTNFGLGMARGDEASAIAALEKLGATLGVKSKGSEGPIVVGASLAVDATDDQLRLLAELPELCSLSLRGARVTDAGLKHLREIRKLRELSLAGTDITDSGMREV